MIFMIALSACVQDLFGDNDSSTPSFEKREGIRKDELSKRLCSHFSHWRKSGVSEVALRQGLRFFEQNIDKFPNTTSFAIADYSQSSTKKRFFVFNWEDGSVQKVHVSHGSGARKINGKTKKMGDIDHDGMLENCDYKGDQTNMTRVGFFRAAEYYLSSDHTPKQWPDLKIAGETSRINGLRLDGLSSTNIESRSRGVVMHEATYNQSAVMGRSYGCPAFRPSEGSAVMPYFAKGGMYYSYVPQCSKQQKKVLEEVPEWEKTCADQ